MKAKEWVKHLVDVWNHPIKYIEPDQKCTAWIRESLKALTECREILAARVPKNQNQFDFDDRFQRAYKEASVKFEAIRHGLVQELSLPADKEHELFPFVKGGLLLNELIALKEDLTNRRIDPDVARPAFLYYSKILSDNRWESPYTAKLSIEIIALITNHPKNNIVMRAHERARKELGLRR